MASLLSRSDRKFSHDYDQALILASVAHKFQCRKKTSIPYIIHPVHVSKILNSYGYSHEIVIAALLHDVLEDTDYESKNMISAFRDTYPYFEKNINSDSEPKLVEENLENFIRDQFGKEVFRLVLAVTDKKVLDDKRSWRERKKDQMAHLDSADLDHAVLKGADLLHNIESLIHQLEFSGCEAFSCFSGKKNETDVPWYYCESARKVVSIIGNNEPLSVELSQAAERLEAVSKK